MRPAHDGSGREELFVTAPTELTEFGILMCSPGQQTECLPQVTYRPDQREECFSL